MVKKGKAKRAAREYQLAHPGMSYRSALRKSQEEHERDLSTNAVAPHADDAPRTFTQPVSSNYLTDPFTVSQDEDVDAAEQR